MISLIATMFGYKPAPNQQIDPPWMPARWRLPMTDHPFCCPRCGSQITTSVSIGGGFHAVTFTLVQEGEPPVNPETTLLRAKLTPDERQRWLDAAEMGD